MTASARDARRSRVGSRAARRRPPARRAAPMGPVARRTHSVGAVPPRARGTTPRGPRPTPNAWPDPPGGALARAPRRPRRTGRRWRCSTASRRRSWLFLPEPACQLLAQAAQLLVTEILVGNKLGQEQLGRAVEHLVHETSERCPGGDLPFDQRLVAVSPAVFGVA